MKYLLLLLSITLIACEDSETATLASENTSPYQQCEKNLEVIGKWQGDNNNMDLEIGNDCYGKMLVPQGQTICVSDFYYWKPVNGLMKIKIEKSDCFILEEIDLQINHQLQPSEFMSVTWEDGSTNYFTPALD